VMLSTERVRGSGAAPPRGRSPALVSPIFIDSAAQEKYNTRKNL